MLLMQGIPGGYCTKKGQSAGPPRMCGTVLHDNQGGSGALSVLCLNIAQNTE